MAKVYQVTITPQAQSQISEIASYISVELEAPDAALNLIDSLEESIGTLSNFPKRVKLTEDEPWRSYGVHKLAVKNFFVYFRIDEDNLEVQVIAVMYAKRNQKKQLLQLNI